MAAWDRLHYYPYPLYGRGPVHDLINLQQIIEELADSLIWCDLTKPPERSNIDVDSADHRAESNMPREPDSSQ